MPNGEIKKFTENNPCPYCGWPVDKPGRVGPGFLPTGHTPDCPYGKLIPKVEVGMVEKEKIEEKKPVEIKKKVEPTIKEEKVVEKEKIAKETQGEKAEEFKKLKSQRELLEEQVKSELLKISEEKARLESLISEGAKLKSEEKKEKYQLEEKEKELAQAVEKKKEEELLRIEEEKKKLLETESAKIAELEKLQAEKLEMERIIKEEEKRIEEGKRRLSELEAQVSAKESLKEKFLKAFEKLVKGEIILQENEIVEKPKIEKEIGVVGEAVPAKIAEEKKIEIASAEPKIEEAPAVAEMPTEAVEAAQAPDSLIQKEPLAAKPMSEEEKIKKEKFLESLSQTRKETFEELFGEEQKSE